MKTSTPRVAAVIGCGKFIPGKDGWAIGHVHRKDMPAGISSCAKTQLLKTFQRVLGNRNP